MHKDAFGNEIKPVYIPQGGDVAGSLIVLEDYVVPSTEHWYVPSSKTVYCQSLIVDGKMTVDGTVTVLGE